MKDHLTRPALSASRTLFMRERLTIALLLCLSSLSVLSWSPLLGGGAVAFSEPFLSSLSLNREAMSRGGVSVALSDPFGDYDPLLDLPPSTPVKGVSFKREGKVPAGFVIATDVGAYFGVSSSFKSNELNTLYGGTHPRFGLSLGARLSAPLELTLSLAMGFGETYERRVFDHAVDIFTKLDLTYFVFELGDAALGLSGGGQVVTYDVEDGTISQLAFGVTAGAKLTYQLGKTSQLYVDFHWSPLYNSTAFHLRDPTEEELLADPEAYKFKVKGEWGHLFHVALGYRLFGF